MLWVGICKIVPTHYSCYELEFGLRTLPQRNSHNPASSLRLVSVRRARLVLAIFVGALTGLACSIIGVLGYDFVFDYWLSAILAKTRLGKPLAQAAPILEVALVITGLACGFLIAMAIGFRRLPRSLLTSAARFRWSLFWSGMVVLGAATAASSFLVMGADFDRGLFAYVQEWDKMLVFGISVFVFSLPLALAEDLIFRGWLVQRPASIKTRTFVLVAVSAFAFCMAHLQWDLASIILRLASGGAYAWAVVRLGGIEFAFGAHVAKNTILVWLLGMSGEHEWGGSFAYAVAGSVAASVLLVIMTELIARRSRDRALSFKSGATSST